MDTAKLQMLVERAQRGDREAEGKLVMAHMRRISGCARSWVIPGVDLAERESACMVGFLAAIRSFDPTKGTQLSTWAERWMRSELGRLKTTEAGELAEGSEDIDHEAGEARPQSQDHDVYSGLDAAWPYLTDAEKRALASKASGATLVDTGQAAGVSKQAVHKVLRAAIRTAGIVAQHGPDRLSAARRRLATQPDNYGHHRRLVSGR